MSYIFLNKSVFFYRYILFHEKENVSYSPQHWDFEIQNCYAFRVCELAYSYWKRAATDQCLGGQADGHCRGTQGDPTLAMQFALHGASIANVIMCQHSPQRATLLPFHISWHPDNDDIIAR